MLVHRNKCIANICLYLSLLVGLSVTDTTAALPSKTVIKAAPYSELINTTTTLSAKLLPTTTAPFTSTKNTKESAETSTKAHSSTTTTSAIHTTRVMHERTKDGEEISTRGKLNTATSVGDNRAMSRTAAAAVVAPTRSSGRLQDLAPIDCDLPTLPRESRLWRANETHELNIPFTVSITWID